MSETRCAHPFRVGQIVTVNAYGGSFEALVQEAYHIGRDPFFRFRVQGGTEHYPDGFIGWASARQAEVTR